MPPPMMTTVWPIATMPMNAATMSSVVDVRGTAKPGEKRLISTNRTSSAGVGEQDRARRAQARTRSRIMLAPARARAATREERRQEHDADQDAARTRPAASSTTG